QQHQSSSLNPTCFSSSQSTWLLPNQVASEQQSLIVVKKLLAIAVSGITYLRGLFPEKAYGTKHVDDQKVMILREEKTCPGASQIWFIVQFSSGADRVISLWINKVSNLTTLFQKVTEFYQFRFQYTKKGSQMDKDKNKVSSMACGNTKKASMLLVRKLYTLMQNLGPLPDNVCLNMKLAYYEDGTEQEAHYMSVKMILFH
uniref:HORMA domain-containing protein n=1 Tax=Periophthalmus magnuspinnatus TaxID=409849 RepID=A0A3B4AGD4_9GOBI